MNVNLQHPMQTLDAWLAQASSRLAELSIPSARLDAEIILAHTIRQKRTYLHAHGDEQISGRDAEIADARIDLRTDRVPIAYIIGHKDFYGRRFNVTSATLIPRPETEKLVELTLKYIPKNINLIDSEFRIVDVGTGSGNIGITIKLEAPETDVTLLEISPYALKVAASNATRLQADVRILRSDLLASYPFVPHIIVANLPYVDVSWERSLETEHEPSLALFADDAGTGIIKKLVVQASQVQITGGILVLEADPAQHTAIITYAKKHRYKRKSTNDYALVLIKV